MAFSKPHRKDRARAPTFIPLRYTMSLEEISILPVAALVTEPAHLYLWVPNALLAEGLHVMKAWGFEYKTNIVWHKIRKDGGSDGRGVGFYFRNVTELILFGVRGKNARTLTPARCLVNMIETRKREHSRKPDELYDIIESCSYGPYLELFARGTRKNWETWGNQSDDYFPTWSTYANHSGREVCVKNSSQASLRKYQDPWLSLSVYPRLRSTALTTEFMRRLAMRFSRCSVS